MPDVDALEARARDAEAAGLAVAGVTKSGGASASAGIGGLVLVTSHGFHGATIASRHGIAMTAIAGDGTGMERDYDFSSTLHASDLEARKRSAAGPANARSNGSIRARSPPAACRWCSIPEFPARWSGILPAPPTAARSPARRVSCGKNSAKRFSRSGIDIIDDPLRPRGLRSRPFDAEGIAGRRRNLVEDGVLKSWLLDCATARELDLETTGHAQRGVSSTPSPGTEQPASRGRRQKPR